MFDDFDVPNGETWDVTELRALIFSPPGITVAQAVWEIRSGVSAGNGGIIVASGTDNASWTPTGNTSAPNGTFSEYELAVNIDGLNITLNPGRYHLVVVPRDAVLTTGNAFLVPANGTNGYGSPLDNRNSFYTGTNLPHLMATL